MAVGFYSLFSPPAVEPLVKQRFPTAKPELVLYFRAEIDRTRLLIEWACIIAGGFVAWVFLPKQAALQAKAVNPAAEANGESVAIEQSVPISPLTKANSAVATMPETIGRELETRVADFVAGEFSQRTAPFRERAARFILNRLRIEAQNYYAEHQSLKGFGDAGKMRLAAAKFAELIGQE